MIIFPGMRRSVQFVVCLILCIGTASILPAQTPDCSSMDLRCPVDKATKLINANPKDPNAYLQRGDAWLEIADVFWDSNLSEDVEQFKAACISAIKDFTKAIELKPDLFEAFADRGIVYSHQGEYALAVKDYGRALELKPADTITYGNRAAAYRQLKNFDAAARDLTKLVEINPKDHIVYYRRGVNYADLGCYDKAIADLDKAIELDAADARAKGWTWWKGYIAAYYDRGLAQFKKGNYEAAIKDLTKVLDSQPDVMSRSQYLGAYRDRAAVYDKTGDKVKAAADRRAADALSGKP